MTTRDNREGAFVECLVDEMYRNADAVMEVSSKSSVGQCGGLCKGYQEKDLGNLCPVCFEALETEAGEIFSVSPVLWLLGMGMDGRG